MKNLLNAIKEKYITPGNRQPWKQQYSINEEQVSDIVDWTTDGSLPEPLVYFSIVVTKNRIYILGGYNGNSYISTVYTAIINENSTLGEWTTGPSLPEPLGSSSVVVIENKVYLLGGFNGNSYVSTVYTTIINEDGTLGEWTIAPSLPELLGEILVVTTKSRVYLLGGVNSNSDYVSTVYTTVINKDGTLGEWSIDSSLPEVFRQPSIITTKNRIYLLGGNKDIYSKFTVYTATIDENGVLGEWSISATLPKPLKYFSTVIIKNKLYLLGGWNIFKTVSTIYKATINDDGSLGKWIIDSYLPEPLEDFSAIVIKNKLHILGGYNDTGYTSAVYSASF